ncbi:phosphate butyryltransferase [Neobacillus sp. YIM B06451]|uniref:phosphate butyryltransferase n=1 Tax=Neobacillus sp. YIM B06451 TaxID=3070994 RepID=UPI00292D0A22|nr:phosphate butyryltransferase [Neobacillus sp. YIM B06451]
MFLESLIGKAAKNGKKTVAVAAAGEYEVLEAIGLAVQKNLANFLLYGDREQIESMYGSSPDGSMSIIHCPYPKTAAEDAVKAVSSGRADVLMKGNVQTSVILKAVLNKDFGLRTGKILSHTAAFEIEGYDRLIFVTDSAMNIAPDLEQKADIIRNAVALANSIGVDNPKVAPLCAVETINPAMQATLDAASLSAMNKRGQISGCIVDGPLALDNAVSVPAAEHKGISGAVAGKADILLVPSIETGNVLYKSLVYFAKAKVGAVICGAKAPIILTSRSDSSESKLYSLALALCSVNGQK